MPWVLETQLSADAASQTIGQQVANPLSLGETAPRDPAQVGSGSIAPVRPSASYFRSTTNNGHHRTGAVGPVGANMRHSLAQQFA
jgi:hypothetical protein